MQQVLFTAVVDRGRAQSVLKELRALGIGGGVILLGEGTVSNKWLEFFGLNETHKDVIFLPVPALYEESLHEMMLRTFKIARKRRGIAFSMPMRRFQRMKFWEDDMRVDPGVYPYHCIVTILNKGDSHACVEAARKAGVSGGTIIHGRGAGVPQDSVFNILFEPEKEIVFHLVPTGNVRQIRDALVDAMDLDQPGRGILFVLPVSRATGLYDPSATEPSSEASTSSGKEAGQ